MLTDTPHPPWATHAMRGFPTAKDAAENAAKMDFKEIGLRQIDEGNWEWFYPAIRRDSEA